MPIVARHDKAPAQRRGPDLNPTAYSSRQPMKEEQVPNSSSRSRPRSQGRRQHARSRLNPNRFGAGRVMHRRPRRSFHRSNFRTRGKSLNTTFCVQRHEPTRRQAVTAQFDQMLGLVVELPGRCKRCESIAAVVRMAPCRTLQRFTAKRVTPIAVSCHDQRRHSLPKSSSGLAALRCQSKFGATSTNEIRNQLPDTRRSKRRQMNKRR